ncbi:hypothetical protein H4582DRAFT_2077587 [Lactarius indigo]|nr:hypothetical protein H4582DRAFT_2077587 [Lactarius indigo]
MAVLPFMQLEATRKRDPAQANGLTSVSSNESTEAHTLPYFLEGPLITPGGTPGWATQPWHYVFNDGDIAWALGGNRRWRLVTVVGDGFIEEIENRKQIAYNVTWACGGVTMRGTFAPGCGDIKPNTLAIRRLLFDEGARRVERRDWQQVLDDNVKLESTESTESESGE